MKSLLGFLEDEGKGRGSKVRASWKVLDQFFSVRGRHTMTSSSKELVDNLLLTGKAANSDLGVWRELQLLWKDGPKGENVSIDII